MLPAGLCWRGAFRIHLFLAAIFLLTLLNGCGGEEYKDGGADAEVKEETPESQPEVPAFEEVKVAFPDKDVQYSARQVLAQMEHYANLETSLAEKAAEDGLEDATRKKIKRELNKATRAKDKWQEALGRHQFAEGDAKMKVVYVGSFDELTSNVKNNTCVVLTAENMDFPDRTESEHFSGLEIEGIRNFMLVGKVRTKIVYPNLYLPVIRIRKSKNIVLENMVLGHVPVAEGETCDPEGYVIAVEEKSNEVHIDSCSLFGSGIVGVYGDDSDNIICKNSEIYECSHSAVGFYEVPNAKVLNCTIRDNTTQYALFSSSRNSNLLIKDCTIERNKLSEVTWDPGKRYFMKTYGDDSKIHMQSCMVRENQYDGMMGGESGVVTIDDSDVMSSNSF